MKIFNLIDQKPKEEQKALLFWTSLEINSNILLKIDVNLGDYFQTIKLVNICDV